VHTVFVLALADTIAFDLATPIEVLGRVRLPAGQAGYRVLVCGSEPMVDAGPLRLAVDHSLHALAGADTVIVPGRCDPAAPVPTAALDALRDAAAAGTRIASICVGAFTLAAAGLLDDRRATTHWAAAEQLRAAFPAVELDPEVLYVDTGQFITSAGATAGVDMCLHLVRRDYGAAIAADASRQAVAPLPRAGGQAQFIVRSGTRAAETGLSKDRHTGAPRHTLPVRCAPAHRSLPAQSCSRCLLSPEPRTEADLLASSMRRKSALCNRAPAAYLSHPTE
jgi:transcriptional regulator GlxA family with amidase domain